ncbi:MAG: C25 family cysteine peptidase [candidate division WOR-3 bacterium]|nr:C25 family cysteine peptidase [candidate division WOR-3 bacterium]
MINTARLVRSIFSVSIPAIITALAFGQTALQQPTGKSVSDVGNRQDAKGKVEMAKREQGPQAREAAEQAKSPETTDSLRLVSSSPNGVVLEFSTDSFSTAGTSEGLMVSATGFDRLAEPGEPDLPSRVVFVGVPQTGGVRLSVSTEGTETMNGARVRPAVGFSERMPDTGYSIQGKTGFWPAAPAEILSIETLRGVRVARVRVSPAQYDPSTSSLRLHHTVRVALSFDRPAVSVDRPDPMDNVIEPMLVNGKEAIGWKIDLPTQDTLNFFDRSNVWCRIKTESTGVYRVTAADLKAAGFSPEAIAPATMKLYSIGRYAVNGPYPDTMVEVPVYVKDNGDAKFDKGEYLAFYAEAPSYWQVDDTLWRTSDTLWRTNVFTNSNCWWLTWSGDNGRRMDTASGAGATNPQPTAYEHVRLESDSLCPARSGLLWLWKDIVKIEGQDMAVTFKLDLPQRDTLRWLRCRFYGRGDGYAYARVYLNGSLVKDSLRIVKGMSRPPAVDFLFDSLPAEAVARAGKPDSLTVELHGDEAMEVFLDFVEVGYAEKLKVTKAMPELEFLATDGNAAEFGIEGATGDVLLLDVTEPLDPVRIVDTDVSANRRNLRLNVGGFRRLRCALSSGLLAPTEVVRRTPGNLRSPAASGDYFVVCPDEFYHAAELFVRYRDGNVAGTPDARVRVAKLSEVYDDYAFGIEEPGAIKRLLQAKRPAYVLLAGDGTYDYRNILNLRTGPVLPPYEVGIDIDPEVYGNAAMALDAWYADLDGGGSAPDLILGRVTVRSAVEFRQFLDRLKKYETQPLGYWAKRLLLLADDEIKGSFSEPDDPGLRETHIPYSEEQAANAAGLLDPVKVYLTEYPLTATNLKAEASAELIRQLNVGALLWCFFGHGAGFQLCHEQALHITNTVPSVNNGTRSPFAFYGSCGVGRFEDTRYEAIAEELVRKEGGTIAGVAATKATGAGGNKNLAVAMFGRLEAYPDDPIGPAFLQGFMAGGMSHEHLFGDPATVLRMPHRGPVPEVRPDTFYPGGRNEFAAIDTASTKGSYEVSAHEAIWHREYHSEYEPPAHGTFSATYDLPGYEIHHAAGTFDSSQILGSFIVPRITYPETTYVGNGLYIRLPNTGRVGLLSFGGSTPLSYERDSILLSKDTVGSPDNEPPLVSLYADGMKLVLGDTTRVPRSFNLVGRLSDASGIFLVPNMDPAIQDVVLSLKIAGAKIPLADYFQYDKNSTVTGRFTYPLELENALDSVAVVASDNMVDPTNPGQNRTRVTVLLQTQLNDALKLTDCLVYPNPTGGAAKFTFSISRAAMVAVKIYTIAGRLVRVLPAAPCGFDYNQIEWDGLDKDGQPLANGVYLYKLDALATESSGGSQSASTSFRGKFIVHR